MINIGVQGKGGERKEIWYMECVKASAQVSHWHGSTVVVSVQRIEELNSAPPT